MSVKTANKPLELVTDTSLQGYFFDKLSKVNQKSLCPVNEEFLFYSCNVLNKFSTSENYFEIKDGKVREKILGVKLLEAPQNSKEEQKRIYLDVGDTSLFLCGYFSGSLNRKIIDVSYYQKLGKLAYLHLDGLVPNYFGKNAFYKNMSEIFELLAAMFSSISEEVVSNNKIFSIFDQWVETKTKESEAKLLVNGIHPLESKISS
ncbi:MAG: hypothetical protein U0T83_09420 [Bacteriovoracaceae bacterium]